MTRAPVRVSVLHTCVLDGAPVDYTHPLQAMRADEAY